MLRVSSVSLWLIAGGLVGAGCLASPEGRRAGDDGGDGDDDAGIDGGTDTDGDDGDELWPPSDLEIDVISARVRDVDDDGADDLLLGSQGVDQSVYLLFGGPGGVGHHPIRRIGADVDADAIEVADLGGSEAPELIVAGTPGGHEDRTTILVYEGDATSTFAIRAWRHDTTALGFDPAAPKRRVQVADLPSTKGPDLFVSSGLYLVRANVPALTEIAITELEVAAVPGGNSGGFLGANLHDVLIVAGDLWVPFWGGVSVFPGGVLRDDVRVEHAAGGNANFVVEASADIDGDGRPEVFGGYGGAFGVTRPGATPDGVGWSGFAAGWSAGPKGEARLIAMRAARLDADANARFDVVVYQEDETRNPATTRRLTVVPNLRLETSLEPPGLVFDSPSVASLHYELPADFAGEVMETGDFDGDGDDEIMVVARDGRLLCLDVGRKAITPCAS